MDSTAVACVRWVPRGRTVVKRRSDAKTKEQLLELAAEMREMNKEANATTDALDNDVSMAASSDTDCPEEPTDTPMSDDDHACTQENQDNDDVTFPGHQFFGTLETDLTHLLTKDPYLNKDGVKVRTDSSCNFWVPPVNINMYVFRKILMMKTKQMRKKFVEQTMFY